MSCRWLASAVVALLLLAGCDSGSKRETEGTDGPAARVVHEFYDAANDSAGEKACALLTARGVRTVVRVGSRRECISTIGGLSPGSFESGSGELVEVEGVEEAGDGFDVDAVVKGRSEGVFSVVERNGRLLIDRFSSKEG